MQYCRKERRLIAALLDRSITAIAATDLIQLALEKGQEIAYRSALRPPLSQQHDKQRKLNDFLLAVVK